MKRTSSLLLAAASLLLVAQPPVVSEVEPFLGVAMLLAAERPRYGGTLRIEMQAALDSLDPRSTVATPQQAEAKTRLVWLVFEGLVRLDNAGRPQPLLALSWQHDAEFRQWQFRLRSGVKFHDGSDLTPAVAAGALELAKATKYPQWRIRVFGETVVIQTSEPTPELLMLLSDVSFAISHPRAAFPLGTGPFRVTQWEAEHRAVFTAFDEYWGGRPFVDIIEVRMARSARDQLADFELSQADVVEVPAALVRSTAQSGGRVWSSSPAELVVLAPPDPQQWRKPREVYRALAFSIDRAAIHSVLLQKQGEPTGALLPEWFTGYAFLFDAKRDLERARQILAESGVRSGPILLAYDSADSLLRAIAERIAVNARDARLTVQVVAASGREELSRADLALVRMNPMSARDWTGGTALIVPVRSALASAAQTADPYRAYAAERESIENAALVPLFHLPVPFGIGGRLRNWQATRWGEWRLADVWLAPEESRQEQEAR